MTLTGKTILITGAAIRVGRALALAAAHSGADIALHYYTSEQEARATAAEIESIGRKATRLQADLSNPGEASALIGRAFSTGPLFALVNNASIFESMQWKDTTQEAWDGHLSVNLTAPFMLSQQFARLLPEDQEGRIINLLDWRALHPGPDHLPYTISKAALAALTRSLAAALAPRISVNGLALGAVLPPRDREHNNESLNKIIQNVPAGRWADLDEICQAFLFLLDGPAYITGEILHVDGGRHLV